MEQTTIVPTPLKKLLSLHGRMSNPMFVFGYVGDDPSTRTANGRREIRTEFDYLAAVTGGRAYLPPDQTKCPAYVPNILDLLHYTYTIGYYSGENPVHNPPTVEIPALRILQCGYSLVVPAAAKAAENASLIQSADSIDYRGDE